MGKRKNSKSRLLKRRITTGVLMMILLTTALFTAGFVYRTIKERNKVMHMTNIVDQDTFYDGTYLDNISLGGMTLKQAKAIFSQKADERLQRFNVELIYNDQSWVFDYEDINARIDWEDKLNELYQIARKGELKERYDLVNKIKDQGIYYETTLTYDTELIREEILEIARSLCIEPMDADVVFYPDRENKFEFSPEKTGQSVDGDQLYQAAVEILESGEPGTVTIEPVVLQPRFTMEQLKKATHLISQFSTDLGTSSQNRIHNVVLALEKLNGLRINPGEVFSFNDSVGPRTKQAGFLPAPVITADKSMKDDWGGGVCQSSTTVFNAAALAGLEIVERYHHSFPVSYVPMGTDASVTYGWADFKFKNNKETPVFIRTYHQGKNVYVEIYGEPIENNGKYEIETQLLESMPAPDPEMIEDKESKYVTTAGQQVVYVSSKPGYKLNAYRVLYENGKKVSSELLVTSFYRPIKGKIYYKPSQGGAVPDGNQNPTVIEETPLDPDTDLSDSE